MANLPAVPGDSEGDDLGALTEEAGGAVVGGAFGYGIGGMAGGLLGLAMSPFFRRLAQLARAEWQRRGAILEQAALTEGGFTSLEGMAKAVEESPELQTLAVRLLRAAEVHGSEERLRALGALFGMAAANLAVVDEAAVLIDAIGDCTELHLSVLAQLASFPDMPEGDFPKTWPVAHIVAPLGLDRGLAVAALTTLTSHGLGEQSSLNDSGLSFGITPLGRRLTQALEHLPPHAHSTAGR